MTDKRARLRIVYGRSTAGSSGVSEGPVGSRRPSRSCCFARPVCMTTWLTPWRGPHSCAWGRSRLVSRCHRPCRLGATKRVSWVDRAVICLHNATYDYHNRTTRQSPPQPRNWVPGGRLTSGLQARLRACHDGVRKTGRYYRYAHRMVWESIHGPLEKGQCVLHRCDNPRCVNPDHLVVGTQADNMKDMAAKGRGGAPSRREALARKVDRGAGAKYVLASSAKSSALAKELGTTYQTIYALRTGIT